MVICQFSGELIAQCQGPTALAYCELVDHRDGTFTLHITPTESGVHVIDIQYGGDPIPGFVAYTATEIIQYNLLASVVVLSFAK